MTMKDSQIYIACGLFQLRTRSYEPLPSTTPLTVLPGKPASLPGGTPTASGSHLRVRPVRPSPDEGVATTIAGSASSLCEDPRVLTPRAVTPEDRAYEDQARLDAARGRAIRDIQMAHTKDMHGNM